MVNIQNFIQNQNIKTYQGHIINEKNEVLFFVFNYQDEDNYMIKANKITPIFGTFEVQEFLNEEIEVSDKEIVEICEAIEKFHIQNNQVIYKGNLYFIGEYKSKDEEDNIMLEIDSSYIELIEYNKQKKILTVYFKSKEVYDYYNISINELNNFLYAESKGRYFNNNIKNKYKYKKR